MYTPLHLKWFTKPKVQIIFCLFSSIQFGNEDIKYFTSNAHQMPPNKRGITTSSASISLEKRDNTRPCGVVSKNSIGNFNTFCNKTKCKTVAACKAPKCGTKPTPYDIKAVN